MTYTAKVTLKYDSTWEQTRGIYDEEMIPEEHITFETPVEDINTIQLFQLFAKFAAAMGHSEAGIAKGAAYVAFNEMRTQDQMRKTADDYDLKLIEDHNQIVVDMEKEIRDLKAKLSRLENHDNPQYTDEEMEAMSHEVADALVSKLQGAYTVCKDCGSKYGEYSVGCSSVWEGKCDVCGEKKPVTEARDYGYLNKGIEELLK